MRENEILKKLCRRNRFTFRVKLYAVENKML